MGEGGREGGDPGVSLPPLYIYIYVLFAYLRMGHSGDTVNLDAASMQSPVVYRRMRVRGEGERRLDPEKYLPTYRWAVALPVRLAAAAAAAAAAASP